jgi:hypothetical protein
MKIVYCKYGLVWQVSILEHTFTLCLWFHLWSHCEIVLGGNCSSLKCNVYALKDCMCIPVWALFPSAGVVSLRPMVGWKAPMVLVILLCCICRFVSKGAMEMAWNDHLADWCWMRKLDIVPSFVKEDSPACSCSQRSCWTMFMLLIVHIFQCPCSLWFWKVPYVAPLWWKEIVSLLPNVRVEENIDKVVYACFIWSLYCYESIGTSHRFALTSLLSFENVKESFLLVVL